MNVEDGLNASVPKPPLGLQGDVKAQTGLQHPRITSAGGSMAPRRRERER